MPASTISLQPNFPFSAVTNTPSSLQYCDSFADHEDNSEPCIPVTYTEKLIHFQHSPIARQILLESVLSQAIENSNSLLSKAPCQKEDGKCVTPVDVAACNAQNSSVDLPVSSKEGHSSLRLNKFVRRLHDMLQEEKDRGVVEWRRGLLVLQNTEHFAKTLLPRYFNTRNFKTFRRQLNYYGFVHVRSFSTIGSVTTALWVNRELAQITDDNAIESVLLLKRVEPCESAKTVEGRRVRKELAMSTVDDDLFVLPKKDLVPVSLHEVSTLNESKEVPVHAEADACVSYGQVPLEIICPPMPMSWDCAQQVSSQRPGDVENAHLQSFSNISRPNSCDNDETIMITQGSNDYSSNSEDEDDSTCAANLLLMLSKNSENHRMVC